MQQEKFVLLSPPGSRLTRALQEEKKDKLQVSEDVSSDETKSPALTRLIKLQSVPLLDPPPRMGLSLKGSRGLRFTTRLWSQTTFQVNSSAGKYKQFIAGVTPLQVSTVGSSSEFASLSAIFDEFFVHRVSLHYRPVNKYSANTTASSSAAGSPGQINTLGAVLYNLQHNQVDYADNSSLCTNGMASWGSSWVNLGDNFTHDWHNVEKFSWDTPLGDQTTSHSTQSWCNINNTSDYGGILGFGTPDPSGASAGIGTLLEGGIFGHVMIEYVVSFRARS